MNILYHLLEDVYKRQVRTDGDNADIGIAELAGDKLANLCRLYLILKLYCEVTSTSEIYTLAQSTGSEESDTYQDVYKRQRYTSLSDDIL